jgi:peptidoglycan/LPS O-acetylase OafA/YrhL
MGHTNMTSPTASLIETEYLKPDAKKTAGRNSAIEYLRAFIIVLVLAHHAAAAYYPYAPGPQISLLTQPRFWEAFPVVDMERWNPFGLFISFNDIFFMALMFFLSGLFVWQSLQRKGSAVFLRDRAKRLGIPFVVAAAVLAPVAYYPSYLQTGATGIFGFWHQWRLLGNWPTGPAWFIWLLLFFDAMAALLFARMPRWSERLGRFSSNASHRPFAFFAGLMVASAIAYIPMEYIFNGLAWASFGPFTFQTSRLLHYAVYFLAGIAVGAFGIERGLLAPSGNLARRWILWIPASLLTFAVVIVVVTVALSSPSAPRFWEGLSGFTFAACCAATSFAFLAVFLRFFAKPNRILDNLSANAYGIYLIHYLFVSWLQYALLPVHLPAVTKALIVLIVALGLSWTVTAAIRRFPFARRII